MFAYPIVFSFVSISFKKIKFYLNDINIQIKINPPIDLIDSVLLYHLNIHHL